MPFLPPNQQRQSTEGNNRGQALLVIACIPVLLVMLTAGILGVTASAPGRSTDEDAQAPADRDSSREHGRAVHKYTARQYG